MELADERVTLDLRIEHVRRERRAELRRDRGEVGLQAVKIGAQDFLLKGDFNYLTLDRAIVYSIERHRLQRTLQEIRLLQCVHHLPTGDAFGHGKSEHQRLVVGHLKILRRQRIGPRVRAIPLRKDSVMPANAVAEAAVVGKAHELKGQAVAAFVTLKEGTEATEELKKELSDHVVRKIGAIARPDAILFAGDLPKTRSGKIMRRLLKDIAEGRALGDTTTLADPSVVARLKTDYEAKEG